MGSQNMGPQKMGLLYGLEKNQMCKRQNHWLFEIPGVSADDTVGVDALPPSKSARPNLTFKEMEARHLHEDVYYPAKPEWKPVTITLYDLNKASHPVWDWLAAVYSVEKGEWSPVLNAFTRFRDKFIKDCFLKLYDGCGNVIESWRYEDSWCSGINFQTLDMTSSEVLTCEITLRYARAYLENNQFNINSVRP